MSWIIGLIALMGLASFAVGQVMVCEPAIPLPLTCYNGGTNIDEATCDCSGISCPLTFVRPDCTCEYCAHAGTKQWGDCACTCTNYCGGYPRNADCTCDCSTTYCGRAPNTVNEADCSCNCNSGFECVNGGSLTANCGCYCPGNCNGAPQFDDCSCKCDSLEQPPMVEDCSHNGGTRNPGNCGCDCPNACQNGGVQNPDCSCSCPTDCNGEVQQTDCSCSCSNTCAFNMPRNADCSCGCTNSCPDRAADCSCPNCPNANMTILCSQLGGFFSPSACDCVFYSDYWCDATYFQCKHGSTVAGSTYGNICRCMNCHHTCTNGGELLRDCSCRCTNSCPSGQVRDDDDCSCH